MTQRSDSTKSTGGRRFNFYNLAAVAHTKEFGSLKEFAA
jgi:hypothetical protein